ncbi:hypothetical protein SpCBS45565_g04006 [Spizellomyces sp. 'palustris']|nr:hypothetical protein SpCBS45565_g04006 [Spizellomyces sp. 'palustris']
MATINPFTVDEERENPFEAPEERPSANNPWGTAPSSSHSRQASSNPYAGKSIRELDLEKREAEVRLKEAQIAEREKQLNAFQIPNWPKFRPMIYHDIEKDIPEGGRWLVKRVYWAWYLAVLVYFVNAIAAFSLLVTKGEAGGATFGLALIIFLIGTPVSFVFWYRPLYNGVKQDSSISFFFFYFNYGFHLGVAALFAVGIPGWGGCGVILALSQLGKNVPSGVLCAISAGLFIFECVYGLWQIKNATVYFRSKGMSAQQARNQAVAGFAGSKVGKELAGQAVKTAVADMRR